MTSTPEPEEGLTLHADPTILVYAVRYALHHTGSHAPQVIAAAVAANRHHLPHGARAALTRDITGWLDGPRARAPRQERQPWVAALAALGVTRTASPHGLPDPVPARPATVPLGRRRLDPADGAPRTKHPRPAVQKAS